MQQRVFALESIYMDVHCFLFTDMLLICKPVGRKGEKMKVIRQPLIVDRLLCREFSKDPSTLGLVYLNEYGTASAALSLHSNNEPKLIRQWLEHIRKAQKLYQEAKEKSHEPVDFPAEVDEEEGSGMMYLTSRSPRGGSSRASQLSSLVHSHSGSIEMNEASAISSRAVSFEQELRGSSLSSDDGNANDPLAASIKSRSLSTETPGAQQIRPSSPRLDRRLFLSKSPTPNTLTVQIPIPNLSGQSLPNLTSASDSSPPTYSIHHHHHHHSLTVPKSLLSPTQRGVSYPPPSPRSLRRSHALLQSRNPPLQKAKNILSPENHQVVEKCTSLDVQVPEIRGVTPPSNDVSPVAPLPVSSFSPKNKAPSVTEFTAIDEHCPSGTGVNATSGGGGSANPDRFNYDTEDEVLIVHSNPERGDTTDNCDRINFQEDAVRYGKDNVIGREVGLAKGEVAITSATSIAKRLARNERSDTKRYHTAGAIEDIKKENSRDKDAAIHKRLSWNYGPQQQMHHQHNLHPETMKNRQFFSCESMGSVRSSSGVSSTSSLLHCISHSDLETTHEGPEPKDHPRLPDILPDVLIAVSEPDQEPVNPHHLLCQPQHHQDQVCNFCESESEFKSRCSSSSDGDAPSPAPPLLCSAAVCPSNQADVIICSVSSTSSCPGSPKPPPASATHQPSHPLHPPPPPPPGKTSSTGGGGIIIMKDFILTDASIEAS